MSVSTCVLVTSLSELFILTLYFIYFYNHVNNKSKVTYFSKKEEIKIRSYGKADYKIVFMFFEIIHMCECVVVRVYCL